MGVLRRVRENVVKSGHVVGLGSSLVLNPSRESKPIGYVDNSGRLQSEACRFTHGGGKSRLTGVDRRTNTCVRAHLGSGSERHTENTASLSLDFRDKDGPVGLSHAASWLKSCTLNRVVTRTIRTSELQQLEVD
eukprot:scaffold10273_cov66-Phaeocystis_antarctica.AAC.1